MIDSPWLGGPDRRSRIFAGLTAAGRSEPRLAEAVRSEVTEPYVEVYRALLLRAVDRHEVSEAVRPRVPLLAQVVPALSGHRLGTDGHPADRAFYVAVVDDVLLPALGLTGP